MCPKKNQADLTGKLNFENEIFRQTRVTIEEISRIQKET